jgi:cob(I)alamin adenosyltransferase
MVTLSKIYTKTGDAGKTRLGDNSSTDKTDMRVEAFGSVDELNAVLGIALADGELDAETIEIVRGIQNDLFDLGADLCYPLDLKEEKDQRLRIKARQVQFIERLIDRFNEQLDPLNGV